MAALVGRGTSLIMWVLGFLFTFLFGTRSSLAATPQMKYGIRPSPPPALEPEVPSLPGPGVQAKYGVIVRPEPMAPIAQPLYGVRPSPVTLPEPAVPGPALNARALRPQVRTLVNRGAALGGNSLGRLGVVQQIRALGAEAPQALTMEVDDLNARIFMLDRKLKTAEPTLAGPLKQQRALLADRLAFATEALTIITPGGDPTGGKPRGLVAPGVDPDRTGR